MRSASRRWEVTHSITPLPRKEAAMKKTLPVLFALLLITAFFVYVSQAQLPQKGSKNTVTLPNGDVIWDLNGEWDVLNENYGLWSQYGVYPNIHKITQTGNSIVGVLMMNDRWYQAGYQYITAQLDKTGFMKVKIATKLGTLDSKGQVSEDGNKIVIDDGEKFKMTFTRK
jgi:hypothetical protein